MPTPSSYPPEPSLDAIEGRATFDGHVIRLERWGREADRRRCAYAAAPIGSVRGVQVMTTPDAAFLVIDVVAPDDNLAEEMADVYICLGMLRDMYGVTDERLESWIDRKTERQEERNRA